MMWDNIYILDEILYQKCKHQSIEDPTSAEGLLKVKSRLSPKLLSDLHFLPKIIAATVSSAMFLPMMSPEQIGQVWKNKS